MPQAALDTHEEVRKLKQAGCPEEHAEAMVDLVSRAPLNAKIASRLERLESKVDIIVANMATKADLEALRARHGGSHRILARGPNPHAMDPGLGAGHAHHQLGWHDAVSGWLAEDVGGEAGHMPAFPGNEGVPPSIDIFHRGGRTADAQ